MLLPPKVFLQDISALSASEKVAYGPEGHTKLTNEVSKSLRAGPAAQRILTEYAAHTADGHVTRSGAMAEKAKQLASQGGRMNAAKAKALSAASGVGSLVDIPTRHPFSPLSQSRHAFPGTLDKARELIRGGRASAGDLLARAALEPADSSARSRLFTRALGHAGESAHIAQDVKPHFITASNLKNEAAAGQHGRRAKALAWLADRSPKSVRPMFQSGVGHQASGLNQGAAALDDVGNITQRELRGAGKHGDKIRLAAIESLRYNHGIPTQQAVQMVDDLMHHAPATTQEVAGKALHRAEDVKDLLKASLRRVLFRR